MARTKNKGLDYTFLPMDFFQDIKIQRLIRKSGVSASPLVYQAFLCLIYKEGYYLEYDSDYCFFIARDLCMEEQEVRDILDICLKLQLFSKSLFTQYGILTSHGIQQFYERTCREARKKVEIKEYSLLDCKEDCNSNSQNMQSKEEINVQESQILDINAQESDINVQECPINAQKRNSCGKICKNATK